MKTRLKTGTKQGKHVIRSRENMQPVPLPKGVKTSNRPVKGGKNEASNKGGKHVTDGQSAGDKRRKPATDAKRGKTYIQCREGKHAVFSIAGNGKCPES